MFGLNGLLAIFRYHGVYVVRGACRTRYYYHLSTALHWAEWEHLCLKHTVRYSLDGGNVTIAI